MLWRDEAERSLRDFQPSCLGPFEFNTKRSSRIFGSLCVHRTVVSRAWRLWRNSAEVDSYNREFFRRHRLHHVNCLFHTFSKRAICRSYDATLAESEQDPGAVTAFGFSLRSEMQCFHSFTYTLTRPQRGKKVEFGGEIFSAWMRATLMLDRKSTRLNSSHSGESRMPSSA